jgi:bla regulator protein blaR1
MILDSLQQTWVALAPGLGDHLWQSTLFAIAAGVLTLNLRKSPARIRYRIWLAASLKFLVPFALLVGLGSHFPWRRMVLARNPIEMKSEVYPAIKEVSQPFTRASSDPLSFATYPSPIRALSAALAAIWFCGFLVVISAWYVRWRRLSAAIDQGVPLREGREVEVLRRLERSERKPTRTEMLLSPASLEPGIFGIVRPVLLWPAGISERLQDAHVEAIVAHELWHVRRRDNLAAALHMVVEAVFWFHPLVWWLGARLADERERACDEEVLALGSERQVYAESILKTCEFCVGFPLACVSRVTGADLKKRIAHIMTQPVARKLDVSKKALLAVAGLAAVMVPVVLGLLSAAPAQANPQPENPSASAPVVQENENKSARPIVAASKVTSAKKKTCSKSAHKAVSSAKSSSGQESALKAN